MMSSVMPSQRWPSAVSPLRLANDSTAIDGRLRVLEDIATGRIGPQCFRAFAPARVKPHEGAIDGLAQPVAREQMTAQPDGLGGDLLDWRREGNLLHIADGEVAKPFPLQLQPFLALGGGRLDAFEQLP